MDAHYYNGDYDVDHPSVEDRCDCGVALALEKLAEDPEAAA